MRTSWAWGPFFIHWKNEAHWRAWQKVSALVHERLRQKFGVDGWGEVHEVVGPLGDALQGRLGSLWREGRAWLSIYPSAKARDEGEGKLTHVAIEWHFFKRQHSVGVGVDIDPDADYQVSGSVRVPGLGVYLSADLPSKWRRWLWDRIPGCRELGVRYHSGALWFNLWSTPDDVDYGKSFRLRQPVFHVVDFLLGKTSYTAYEAEHGDGTLHLSGSEDPDSEQYPITWMREIATWRRPRWPWPKVVSRVSIEIEAGIPIPGKGENGWDCDDDATYAYTTTATTVEEAAQALIADIRKTRQDRGGRDWKPVAQ